MDISIKRSLYYFNPGHEAAILNESPYYTPPKNIAILQNDLAYLPAWLGTIFDFVILDKELPKDFEKQLESLNIPVSKGITNSFLRSNQLNLIAKPWGLSPQSEHYFEQIHSSSQIEVQIPKYNDRLKELSGRHTARKCLSYLCDNISEISSSLIPEFFSDIDSIEKYVEGCDHQLLAKAPYSSSGRGLLWIPVGIVTRTERQILQGILNKQKSVSLEKAQERLIDFAMEFQFQENNKLDFIGYSLFETSTKGVYQGNYLGSQQKIVRKLYAHVDKTLLETVKNTLIDFLQTHFTGIYSGSIGVDMMIYKDEDGIKLHPCLEINVRANMGIVAIKLSENYIHSNAEGRFIIDLKSDEGEILEEHLDMQKQYPIEAKNGKITSGYLSLCPISKQTKYRAYVLINN